MNRLLGVAGVLLLGIAAPSTSFGGVPAVGVHTIRADDAQIGQAAEGGFSWLIQLVAWRDVEPSPGRVFWEATDWLVRAAEYYGLDLVLRLDAPPPWAFSADRSPDVDTPAYAAFVGRVAARYRGRVEAWVVWNEPNLAVEWGGLPPDPAGHVELLCAAYAAIRQADPTALDKRRFLEAMYDAGASTCVAVLGAHPYGVAYPPDDPPGVHDDLNLSRVASLRAIMGNQGGAHSPVWATELGWTIETVEQERAWPQVSEAEQAHYLVEAVQRAQQAWLWLQRIVVWNLRMGLPADDEMPGYSILADGGTPKPAYTALQAALATQAAPATREPSGVQHRPASSEILAPDVVVRLSDVGTGHPHWARPHCATLPCRVWIRRFYIREPGTAPRQLRMEAMQVEEAGNRVAVNGRLLGLPTIPLRGRPDFASVWTSVDVPVPATLLQAGLNTLEIRSSPRLSAYPDAWARFESLHVRNVRLVPIPP